MGERVLSGFLSAGLLGILSLSAWLSPSSDGHGTHTQLGMRPCMWAAALDKPCPTCGMTTSFAHAGEGHWLESFTTQPMGTLLVILTSVIFWGALAQTLSGARLGSMIQPALRPRVIWTMVALLMVAWIYKIVTW